MAGNQVAAAADLVAVTGEASGAVRGRRIKIAALVIAIGAILGFNIVALKVAMLDASPLTVQALSTVIGTLAMLLVTRAIRDPVRIRRRHLPGAFRVGMAMTVVSALGVSFGAERVSSGLAALLLSATAIFTLILDFLIHRQRHSWHAPIGVLLGFAGVAIVASGSGHSELLGVLFLMVGAFGWSLGLVLMRSVGRQVAPTTFIFWQMLLGVPVLLVVGYFVTGLQAHWSLAFVLALTYAGAMAKSASFVLQMLVVRIGTALHASLTAFVMPIFASLAGVLVLGERIRLVEVYGAITILGGVALVLRARVHARWADDDPDPPPVPTA